LNLIRFLFRVTFVWMNSYFTFSFAVCKFVEILLQMLCIFCRFNGCRLQISRLLEFRPTGISSRNKNLIKFNYTLHGYPFKSLEEAKYVGLTIRSWNRSSGFQFYRKISVNSSFFLPCNEISINTNACHLRGVTHSFECGPKKDHFSSKFLMSFFSHSTGIHNR
jgi:hypothetical protein